MTYSDAIDALATGLDNSSTGRTAAAALGALPTAQELLAAILLAGSVMQFPVGSDAAPLLARALEWADLLMALSEGSVRKGGEG